MKIPLSLLVPLLSASVVAQHLDVEGGVKVGNVISATNPGTIRWNGTDFEGWNGTEWVSFTKGMEYLKDIENNYYKIVTIGTQTWMAENLRVTRYNDGTSIPLVTEIPTWTNSTTPGYTWYNNAPSEYGALYNYYVAADTNSRNVCPTGWHVPTVTEWMTLINYLGGETIAGGKMKEAGLSHWLSPNIGASNESNFTGLPGGRRKPDGDFERIGVSMDTWSSSLSGGGGAWFQGLFQFDGYGYLTSEGDTRWGFSIRCLKD